MKQLFSENKIEIGALGVGLLGVFVIIERAELRKILGELANVFKMVGDKVSGTILVFLENFSISDVVGLLVIFFVMAFLLWRVRGRFEKSNRWMADVCPRCGSGLHRIHRTSFDHFLSQTLLPDARRYRCANYECVWEGLRRRRASEHHHHKVEIESE